MRVNILALVFFGLLSVTASLYAQQEHLSTTVINEVFGYELTTNVVYGKGAIMKDGKVIDRDLLMDVYKPTDKSFKGARPAVILVHGGSYQIGGLRKPPYKEAGAVHSRMEDYARLLTPLGYVCFVIDYRLVPEYPIPAMAIDADVLQDYKIAITPSAIQRSNLSRSKAGIRPLRDDEAIIMWKGVLSAAEDLDKAVRHVRDNASRYGTDPDKIAMGGHSAGAGAVVNAGFGLKSPVAAMFPLSPGVIGFNMQKVIDGNVPNTLLVTSQNDDPAISEGIPATISKLRSVGAKYQLVWVPGFPHFYPTGAVSLGDNGTRMSVGERVVGFLDQSFQAK